MELDDGALCDATWTGPRLHDVLKRAGIRPEASEIMIRDTSATPSDMASETPASLPIKRALAADTIIALSLIGAEIPVDLACFPLIITPGLVANNGRNSFNDLEIRTARPDSRLPDDNSNLYAVITDIPLNARATSHRDGDRVRGAGFSLSGLAWDNGAGIDRVEISINDGQNWGRAMMERSPGRFAFQPWRMQVTASPGSFTIFIRAIGKLGIWQDKPGASLTAQQQISPTQVLKLVAQ
jgi:DMSO/TMAO reductase YedYZ molybdopterin-dependent catalytic subunit